MGDYGIRVSKTGKDVLTDADFDMALTSKFSTYKVESTASGTFNISAGNAGVTITATHNLGYNPMFFGYIKKGDYTYVVVGDMDSGIDVATDSGTSRIRFQAYHGSVNNVKLRAYTADSAGVTNNEPFTFYFLIMLDQL